MSLKAYHKILEKAEVDEFFGNEDKIREVLSELYLLELEKLSKEIGIGVSTATSTISILKKEPSYGQRLFLRKLYNSKIPITYGELMGGTIHPQVALTLFEEIRIVKIDKIKIKEPRGYIGRKAIVEIDRPLMKRYWPRIESFEEEYIPRNRYTKGKNWKRKRKL